MPTIVKLISPQEAAEHRTKEDCWIIVDGMVYDVTEYLDDHPGGDDIIVDVAGKDATEEFEDAGHSKTARELMKGYCIGEVDPVPPLLATEVAAEGKPSMVLWASAALAVAGIALVASFVYSRRK